MDLWRHRTPTRGWTVWRLWALALWLCWPLAPGPAHAAECQEAALMLIHPAVTPPYDRVIEELAEGLADGTSQPIGVCALEALSARTWRHPPRQVVAVGADAYAATERAFPGAQTLPILVPTLPAPASRGLSRFVAPELVLAPLRALAPASTVLYFIHRQEVPAELLRRTRAAAEARGFRWVPIAVGGLRAAARAIERVRQEADASSAVWLHRDVLALNPDILIPPIVRRSWEVGFAVVSDDAETVERGLLFSLTPDYRAVGRAAVRLLGDDRAGLHDLRWTHRVLNARTARAIGLAVHPEEASAFDAVHD